MVVLALLWHSIPVTCGNVKANCWESGLHKAAAPALHIHLCKFGEHWCISICYIWGMLLMVVALDRPYTSGSDKGTLVKPQSKDSFW
jgi:hypothetical protein